MGAKRRILRWIRFGYPLKFDKKLIESSGLPRLTRSAHPSLVTTYKDPDKQLALQNLVNDLVTKRCIVEMNRDETGYFSRVFLVPKKSGGFRLVIDLS